jgi:toxin ParE1/3/4
VLLTERALADLRDIERYSIGQWGRKTAEKYLNDIELALDRLRENPGLLRLEPDFAPGLFFYRARKHVLVCDVQGQNLTVLTVIHTSMDLPARLAELEPRLTVEAQLLHKKLRRESKVD